MERLILAALMVPVFLSFYLAAAGELITTSQTVSDKAINFAGDMEAAVPCASRGIPLEECSPNLLNTSFDADMDNAYLLSQRLVNESSAMLNQYKE